MSELQRMARQRAKGLKRRASETAAKFKERLALKMEHPGDRLDINEETELFSLVKVRGGIDGLMDNSGDVIIDEEEEAAAANAANAESSGDDDDDDGEPKDDAYTRKLDEQLEAMYSQYQERTQRRATHLMQEEDGPQSKKQRLAKRRAALKQAELDPEELAREVAAKEMKRTMADDDAPHDDGDADDDDEDDDDDDGGEDEGIMTRQRGASRSANPLLVALGAGSTRKEQSATRTSQC